MNPTLDVWVIINNLDWDSEEMASFDLICCSPIHFQDFQQYTFINTHLNPLKLIRKSPPLCTVMDVPWSWFVYFLYEVYS